MTSTPINGASHVCRIHRLQSIAKRSASFLFVFQHLTCAQWSANPFPAKRSDFSAREVFTTKEEGRATRLSSRRTRPTSRQGWRECAGATVPSQGNRVALASRLQTHMPIDYAVLVQELDTVLALATTLRRRSKYNDCSDLQEADVSEVITTLTSAVERLAPPNGTHAKRTAEIMQTYWPHAWHKVIEVLPGVVKSLREDYANGRMMSAHELIHADMFADFLEGAAHLVLEGYKDAAAVIAGSVLEGHLRALCTKNSIPTDDSRGAAKKASLLNTELRTNNVYTKSDEKSVTAWLDLRNNAAHGHYAAYTADQVKLLIDSVRDFITRRPA